LNKVRPGGDIQTSGENRKLFEPLSPTRTLRNQLSGLTRLAYLGALFLLFLSLIFTSKKKLEII